MALQNGQKNDDESVVVRASHISGASDASSVAGASVSQFHKMSQVLQVHL